MSPQTLDLIRSIQAALEGIDMEKEPDQWRPDGLSERDKEESYETKPAASGATLPPSGEGVKL